MPAQNSKAEPIPTDIEGIFQAISSYHGPNRYAHGAGEFNGCVAHLEKSKQFKDAIAKTGFSAMPDRGKGAIWGWFVGSPRAFIFGLERTKSLAVRRMESAVRREWELATGKTWPSNVKGDAA